MMTDDDIVECFFRHLDDNIQQRLQSDAVNKSYKVVNIFFCVGECRYLVSVADEKSYETVHSADNPSGKYVGVSRITRDTSFKIPSIDVTLSCSLSTMSSICMGKVKPMSLLLNGSLKMVGERKNLYSLLPLLRLSVESTIVTVQIRTSNRTESILDAHVLGTIEVPENDFVDKTFVKYVVEVKNLDNSYSWNVSRRFSEFITLRRNLLNSPISSTWNQNLNPKKTLSLPSLTSGSSGLFTTKYQLVKHRIATLTTFIQGALFIFAQHNADLNLFLGYDRKSTLLHSLTATLRTSNTAATTDFYDETETAASAVASATKQANRLISCDLHTGPRLAMLHLDAVKRTKNCEIGGTRPTGGVIMYSVRLLLLAASLCLSWVTVSGALQSCHFTHSSHSSPERTFAISCDKGNKSRFQIFWLSLLCNLVYVPMTRRSAVLALSGHCCREVVIMVSKGGLAQSILSNIERIGLYNVLEAFVKVVFNSGRLLLFNCCNSFMAGYHTVVFQSASGWRALSALELVVLVCLPCASFVYCRRILRSMQILLLGSTLLVLYGGVRLVSAVCRLSPSTQDKIYDQVDDLLIPFILFHFGQLKSLFVKCAQFVGGRADFLSAKWTRALSTLQDECPCSGADYARETVERNFGAVDEVFESFDWTPVASASVGQVHFAVLKETFIRNIQSKQALLRERGGGAGVRESGSESTEASSSSASGQEASSDLEEEHSTWSLKRFRIPDGYVKGPLAVVVKVQHENIGVIMRADLILVLWFIRIVEKFDSRWKTMVEVLQSWEVAMVGELDFETEAKNLDEVGRQMAESKVQVLIPAPIPGLVSTQVLVMTRLDGYKVTDKNMLTLLNVDKKALLSRIAHASAYQMLVAGFFNADPHAGNLMFCPQYESYESPYSSSSSFVKAKPVTAVSPSDDCLPGLLDFGMTVRLTKDKRRAYCRLMLGLFEGDMEAIQDALRSIGYVNSQSVRAPERDAEFFAYLMRDAKVRATASAESKAFSDLRAKQKQTDEAVGVREKAGRQVSELPLDFVFLYRVIGLLRGLTAELEVECPIMHIFALHAKVGILRE